MKTWVTNRSGQSTGLASKTTACGVGRRSRLCNMPWIAGDVVAKLEKCLLPKHCIKVMTRHQPRSVGRLRASSWRVVRKLHPLLVTQASIIVIHREVVLVMHDPRSSKVQLGAAMAWQGNARIDLTSPLSSYPALEVRWPHGTSGECSTGPAAGRCVLDRHAERLRGLQTAAQAPSLLHEPGNTWHTPSPPAGHRGSGHPLERAGRRRDAQVGGGPALQLSSATRQGPQQRDACSCHRPAIAGAVPCSIACCNARRPGWKGEEARVCVRCPQTAPAHTQ